MNDLPGRTLWLCDELADLEMRLQAELGAYATETIAKIIADRAALVDLATFMLTGTS